MNHAVRVPAQCAAIVTVMLLAVLAAALLRTARDNSRIRTSAEIDDFGSTYCFPNPRCRPEQLAILDEGLDLMADTTWLRCVSAGCRLYDDCGVPSLETLTAYLEERGWDARSEVTRDAIDKYDLRHARAIINHEISNRWDALVACHPPHPANTPLVYTFLTFTIAPDGTLATIRFDDESRRDHPSVARCIVDALADLQFPPSILNETLEVTDQVHI